jgi:hypothetical protein
MSVTSGVFGKLDCQPGVLTKIWYNSSTNAATVDIVMCNRGGSRAKVRIAIIPASTDSVNTEDYIVFNQAIDSGSTFTKSRIVVSTQETIYVYSDTIGVSARVHGFINDLGPAATDIGMATTVNAGLTVYASGFDVTSEDKAITPAGVKRIVDAYGGGSGGGVGLTKMVTILTSKLLADTDISVPNYKVGINQLSVFIDGVLAIGGSDRNYYAYEEIGVQDIVSNSIKLFDSYEAGTEIVVMA